MPWISPSHNWQHAIIFMLFCPPPVSSRPSLARSHVSGKPHQSSSYYICSYLHTQSLLKAEKKASKPFRYSSHYGHTAHGRVIVSWDRCSLLKALFGDGCWDSMYRMGDILVRAWSCSFGLFLRPCHICEQRPPHFLRWETHLVHLLVLCVHHQGSLVEELGDHRR